MSFQEKEKLPEINSKIILDQIEKLNTQLANSIQSINVSIVAAMQPVAALLKEMLEQQTTDTQ
jgi:hypothetical protein